MLSHYMNDKGVHMTDEDKGQTDQKSFMQKHKNVTCYTCGKKGHCTNKCPNRDNNDEASTRSSPSNNCRPNHVGWSGYYVGLTLLEARSMIAQECVGQT
jgi:hypothetical protein